MAIKFEKLKVGMTLYYRFRQKMGNTSMSTTKEGRVMVLDVDGANRTFRVRTAAGDMRKRATDCGRYFAWSMHDSNEAVCSTGLVGRVGKVTRRKKCPKCKTRHASEECPDRTGDAIRSLLETT